MKKLITIIILLAAITAGTFVYFQMQKEDNVEIVPSFKPLIKVGLIYPTTGNSKHLGEAMKTALKLFEQDSKTKKSNYSFELQVQDNQLNPTKTITIANKLKNIDQVDAYITITNNIGSVVSLIADKNEVIHFAIANDQSVKGKYNFNIATPPNKEAEKLLKELQKRGITKVALITQNQGKMLGISTAIRDQAKNYEVEIIIDNITNTGDRDFSKIINKIKSDKPEIVIAQLFAPELLAFAKQLKEIIPNSKITNIETMSLPDDKRLLEGDWYIDAATPNSSYIKSYQKESGSNITNDSELAYTALQILRDSLDAVGSNKEDLIKYLTTGHEIKTVIGPITYNQDGIMQSEASIKQIRKGQPILLKD